MEQKQTLAQQAASRDSGEESISGDYVRKNQEMAADEGFSAVSRPWWEKTKPVDGVVDALISDSEECLDLEVEPGHIKLDDDGTLTLDGEKLRFSNRALGNLCEWAKAPTGIREALLSEGDETGQRLFSEIINRGFNLHLSDRENDLKLRLRGTTVRAVVSHQYASIENSWTMETLSDMIPDARVSHFRYDGDTMSGLLLIPDTIREEKDSDYGGGIHFKNSEVGTATLFIRPSVFRSICMNGCIWGELAGESYVSKKHSGTIDFSQVATDIHTIINEQIPLTTKCIDQMLSTQRIALGNRIDCLKVIAAMRPAKGLSLSQSLRRAWVDGWVEEGAEDTSAFGLIQGLTRAARDCKDASSAVGLEMLAGSLVSAESDFWSFEKENADRRMTDTELARILSEPLINEALR